MRPGLFVPLIFILWIVAMIVFFALPCDSWWWDIVPIGEVPGRCL